MSYISPLPDLDKSNYLTSGKIIDKDIVKGKLKNKGLHSYLSSTSNLSYNVAKINSRKTRLLNKSQDFIIKATRSKESMSVVNNVSMFTHSFSRALLQESIQPKWLLLNPEVRRKRRDPTARQFEKCFQKTLRMWRNCTSSW